VLGIWLAVLAMPLVLCLAIAYGLSILHFRDAAQTLAERNARRAAEVLAHGDLLLADLARTTEGHCSPAIVAAMGQAVFHSVYFREAGIEQDGNLVCTSVEMMPPGFNIPNATRRPAGRVGATEILAPTRTIRGGSSLILNRPLTGDRKLYINLLLDPQLLVETVGFEEGLEATTFLDDHPNGGLLALDQQVPALVAELHAPLSVGAHQVEGGLYAVARAGDSPLYAVMSVSNADVARHWRTQMQPAAFVGFLASLLALLLLRRYLPQRSALEDLRDAIAAGEMLVEYQPIVDAVERRVVGAEALVRWQHPQRGRVMPDEFIPLAESSGLITPLTDRVLESVKRDLDRLKPLPPGFRISINLARAQLTDQNLLRSLDALFGPDARLDALGFEVTEREMLANVAEQARTLVTELRRRGAEVSIDDFGTGYSGLSHLRHLPLHHIKIDRSFVRALDTEAVTANLVVSIVALARSLELGLIAEGVETERQREALLALGVRVQQGWLYSKAVDVAGLQARLAQR